MKRRSDGLGTLSLFVSVVLGVGALLLLVSFALASCGPGGSLGATTLNTGVTTTTTTSDVSARATVVDTGYTSTTATPASVPALGSGITSEQVLQLVASKSNVPTKDWELRECKTLDDWAVANLYTSQLSEQMDKRGVGAVFQEKSGAWFFKGWVSVADSSNQQAAELGNMGAPKDVWTYFGLEPATPDSASTTPTTSLVPAVDGFLKMLRLDVKPRDGVHVAVGGLREIPSGKLDSRKRLIEGELIIENNSSTPFAFGPNDFRLYVGPFQFQIQGMTASTDFPVQDAVLPPVQVGDHAFLTEGSVAPGKTLLAIF